MNEVVRYYDDIAHLYETDRFENSYGQFIDYQERRLLSALLTKNESVVVDLACGSGRLLGFADYGVDASAKMVEIAQQKWPQKTIYLAEADSIPSGNNSVDVVFCFHLFMHLSERENQKILEECWRVLKPNGRLLLDFPSESRRRLINYQAKGWHGAYCSSVKRFRKTNRDLFDLKRAFGIMLLPIHRFPSFLRKAVVKMDFFLANCWFLKSYSSYLVVELVKK